MKRLWFVLMLVFIVLTFVGAGYVLVNGGKVNAGYAVIPMLFTLIFKGLYRYEMRK